jgi:hypothetical protein
MYGDPKEVCPFFEDLDESIREKFLHESYHRMRNTVKNMKTDGKWRDRLDSCDPCRNEWW